MHSRDPSSSLRFAFFVAAALVSFVDLTWTLGTARSSEFVVGWLFDVCAWAALWLVGEGLARVGRARALGLPQLAFYPALYFSLGLVFAHTWFFDAAIERRLTVFDMTLAGIYAFFAEVLPTSGWLALVAVLVALHLVALLGARWLRPPSVWLAWSVFVGLCTLTAFAASLSVRVPSPLFDSAFEVYELAMRPVVVPEPHAKLPFGIAALDRSGATLARFEPVFDKVVVLVMETMTERVLERERAKLPASTFLRSERAHFHSYSNYYANNQDSRTGMLDILTSRLIPYEAYGDEDVARYERIVKTRTLVDRFRELGFHTLSTLSQMERELVVTDLPWDEQVFLTEQQFANAGNRFVCIHPDVWERSCEDRVLLPQMLDALAAHERVFVFHEFVWGHAWEYNEASGQSNTAYYSAFVDELLQGLRARGLDGRTLIALTSDHGFRDKGLATERWVYEIPLLFYAPRFGERDDGRLFSHVSFAELLFAELSPTPLHVEDSPVVMIVGPSGNHTLTMLTSGGAFDALRTRGSRHMLLRSDRPSRGDARTLSPAALLGLFERYRDHFDRSLGQGRHD